MSDLKQLYDAVLNGDAGTAKRITEQAITDCVDPEELVDKHLMPVWIDAGANANRPIAVAAGKNDWPAMRKQFGAKMAYRGGVDKRAMAKGGQVIIDEMAQLSPAIRSGGVLPGRDHGIPSDVSWPNFVEYCRLLARETGWLD